MSWVIAANAVVWIAIFGYMFMVAGKQRQCDRRIAELRNLLNKNGTGIE